MSKDQAACRVIVIINRVIQIAIIIIAVYIVFSQLFSSSRSDYNDTYHIWEQSYEKVKLNSLGIVFDGIKTTSDEYRVLKQECSKNIDILGANKSKVNTLSETGPLYLDDMLIIRYVNKGTITLSAAVLKQGKLSKKAVGIDIDDIRNFNKEVGEVGSAVNGKGLTDVRDRSMSEEEYIGDIKRLLELTFSTYRSSNNLEVNKLAKKYFTYEGKRATYGELGRVHIKDDVKSEVVFIQACKSDINKSTKDRIYVQLDVSNKSQKIILNIVLKIKSSGHIFDLDIL